MSNVSDRRMSSVALKESEKLFFIGALLQEKEANKSNPDFVSALDELYAIGQGKGLPFEFLDGETITIDPFDQCVIVVRHSELNGKVYSMLSVIVDSDMRGEDLEVPLSIFRRVPELAEDRAWLVEDSPINEKMLRQNLSDLSRLLLIAGHKLSVNASKRVARADFRTENGKTVRLKEKDILALAEEDRKKFWCYKLCLN